MRILLKSEAEKLILNKNIIEIESHQLNAPIIVIFELSFKRILCNCIPFHVNFIQYIKYTNKIIYKNHGLIYHVSQLLGVCIEIDFKFKLNDLCSLFIKKKRRWLFFYELFIFYSVPIYTYLLIILTPFYHLNR